MKHYALLILSILILPLNSCMMWMHGMDHGTSHQMQGHAKTIEKDIPEEDARLALEVPPLFAGVETALILTASSIRNGAPLNGATVTFLVERLQQHAAEHADFDVLTSDERGAEEIAGKGIYQVRYKFKEPGLYRITAHARIEAKEGVPAPLKIAIVQDAGRREGHDNEESIRPWMVVGGIGMAVMMLMMAL